MQQTTMEQKCVMHCVTAHLDTMKQSIAKNLITPEEEQEEQQEEEPTAE
jgi:hypothetical protein